MVAQERLARKAAEKAAKAATAQTRKAAASESRKCDIVDPLQTSFVTLLLLCALAHLHAAPAAGRVGTTAARFQPISDQSWPQFRLDNPTDLALCREKELRRMADGALRVPGRVAPQAPDDEDLEARMLLQQQRDAGCAAYDGLGPQSQLQGPVA